MSRFRYTPQAEADLDEITDYYAAHDPDAGIRLLDAVTTRCRQLARFPKTGTPREALGPGVRSAVVGRYVIFFRATDDGVAILRVLHGSRDIGPDLFEPE